MFETRIEIGTRDLRVSGVRSRPVRGRVASCVQRCRKRNTTARGLPIGAPRNGLPGYVCQDRVVLCAEGRRVGRPCRHASSRLVRCKRMRTAVARRSHGRGALCALDRGDRVHSPVGVRWGCAELAPASRGPRSRLARRSLRCRSFSCRARRHSRVRGAAATRAGVRRASSPAAVRTCPLSRARRRVRHA